MNPSGKRQEMTLIIKAQSEPSCLETLPADVVAETLRYLQVPEWFNLSMSSKRCLELVVNQVNLPKVAVVDIQRAQGVMDLIHKLASWKPIIFDRHQKQADCGGGAVGHLCIRNMNLIYTYGATPEDIERLIARKGVQLDGISSLDISLMMQDLRSDIDSDVVRGIALMCPNLKELDLSGFPDLGIQVPSGDLSFCEQCPHLEKVTWDKAALNFTVGSNRPTLDLKGSCFRKATNLRELYLEDAVLLGANTFISFASSHRILEQAFHAIISAETSIGEEEEQKEDKNWLLCECNKGLTRLDLKGVKYTVPRRCLPLPQHALLKLVRCSPNLKWFRSDLSEENVDILKKERPDVTFVSSKHRVPSNIS